MKSISRIRTLATKDAKAPSAMATTQSFTVRRSTTDASGGTCSASLTRSSEGEMVSPSVVAEWAFSFLIIQNASHRGNGQTSVRQGMQAGDCSEITNDRRGFGIPQRGGYSMFGLAKKPKSLNA